MARGQAMTDPGPLSMPAVPAPSGLEAVYLDHRAALVRFLRARGAGDRAEDLVQELWLRIVSTPSGPVFDPLNYLFRGQQPDAQPPAHRKTRRSTRRGMV
jgi:RNA polymerase sigma-70 factor (ECF subfamily)